MAGPPEAPFPSIRIIDPRQQTFTIVPLRYASFPTNDLQQNRRRPAVTCCPSLDTIDPDLQANVVTSREWYDPRGIERPQGSLKLPLYKIAKRLMNSLLHRMSSATPDASCLRDHPYTARCCRSNSAMSQSLENSNVVLVFK